MKFKVPWHVKGVHPDARDSARAAARQAGMSVGDWLNSMILESAGEIEAPNLVDARPAPAYREPPREDRRTDLAPAPEWRREARRGEFDRTARGDRPLNRARPDHDATTQHLAKAIARLDQRMDEIIQERRNAARSPKTTSVNEALSDLGRERVRAVSGDWGSNVDQAVAEISQRMRELDSEAPATVPSEQVMRSREVPGAASSSAAASNVVTPDGMADVQEQLRQITAQIRTLDVNRAGETIAALRNELAGIARTLIDASPRRAIEALEGEVRALAVQLDATRRTANAPEFASLERGLAEVRDAVRTLAPAESLAGAVEAIHVLATKIDQMAAAPQDAAAMEQLETAIAGLRGIASHAASSEALAALTIEVRAIAAKVDNELPGVARGNAILNSLEARIATIADAIESVRTSGQEAGPADFNQALQTLGDRMERLYSVRGGSAEFAQLQERLDRLVEKFDASDSRLRSLDTIEHGVKELFAYLDEVRSKSAAATAPLSPAPAFDNAIIGQIEERFEQLSQRFDMSDSRLRSLDAIERGIKELFASIDELRRASDAARTTTAPVAEFDHGAIEQLDRRIQGLTEKIETAVARTGGLDAIERGMTAVLAHLRETRSDAVRQPPAAPSFVVTTEREIKQMQDSREAARDTIGDVVDRLAMIETGLRGGEARVDAVSAPEASAHLVMAEAVASASDQRMTLALPTAPMAATAPSQPAALGALPYDHPLEPGSGKPRPGLTNLATPSAARMATVASPPIVPEHPAAAPASAADRIAASKAAIEASKSAKAEMGPRPNYIVAARRAAQAAAQGQSASAAGSGRSSLGNDAAPASRAARIGKHIKSALVGISVLVILAGAIHLVVNYFEARTPSPDQSLPQSTNSTPGNVLQSEQSTADDPERELIAKFMRPEDPTGGRAGVLPAPPSGPLGVPSGALLGVPPSAAGAIGTATPAPKMIQIPAAPAAPEANQKPQPAPDLTGSIAPLKLVPPPDGLFGPQSLARAASLPTAIGGRSLVVAAEGGDPIAAYEVAVRFTEGRGVAVNTGEAAAWFEQAARAGVVPALFRLGGHYEKGIGVKKDLIRARDLYVAAANSGNAKAMHNLAVIYAEGIDGKPDYANAMQWFRKAAGYGVADSQFNLGVLYARGIGVEQNLAEAFKWFALAALQGDQDATQKRDDVAKRLDPQTLNAARQAVQNWVAEQQPDEAVSVRTPPGGWDQGAPPPATRQAKPNRV